MLPPDEERSVEWPHDFYVSDIVECFLDCKTSVKRGSKKTQTLKVIFAEHFPGVHFKPSTYHNQRAYWTKAPKHLKKQFCEAGRTKAGRWTRFTSVVREYNAAQSSSTSNVIELSD